MTTLSKYYEWAMVSNKKTRYYYVWQACTQYTLKEKIMLNRLFNRGY